LAVCQDVKPHPEGFIISREFAELTAARFDSLKFYKAQTEKLTSAADTCTALLNYSERIIAQQNVQITTNIAQLNVQNEIIKTYANTENINKALRSELKGEVRRKKAWKTVAVTGLSLLGSCLLYIAIF
jgi:hypothetical protein